MSFCLDQQLCIYINCSLTRMASWCYRMKNNFQNDHFQISKPRDLQLYRLMGELDHLNRLQTLRF
jgi:hypothetical protein